MTDHKRETDRERRQQDRARNKVTPHAEGKREETQEQKPDDRARVGRPKQGDHSSER